MRKLLVLVVIGVVAWYGWNHRSDLNRVPHDEAVIENQSGRGLNRVRLTVGGTTYVRESIPDGGKETIPFTVTGDGSFTLVWQFDNDAYDKTWSGGEVSAGPLRSRHHIQVMGDAGVIWSAERMLGKKP